MKGTSEQEGVLFGQPSKQYIIIRNAGTLTFADYSICAFQPIVLCYVCIGRYF
jgi:hypothetical protein